MYRLIILILALTVANMPFATSDAQTKKKTTTTAVAKKKPVRKASTAAKGGKKRGKRRKETHCQGKAETHIHKCIDTRTAEPARGCSEADSRTGTEAACQQG